MIRYITDKPSKNANNEENDMGKQNICDLCEDVLLEKFSDKAYKITVKRLTNAYDGFAPWVRKQTLDVCNDCMLKLVYVANNKLEKLVSEL